MTDQQKNAIQVLINAADQACSKGAFNLLEASNVGMAAQIASSLLVSEKQPEKPGKGAGK